MSPAKIGILLLYLVLAVLAITQGEANVGVWSLRLLLVLAAVHLIEVVVYFKLCQSAGGSLPMHLLNVFLFGVFHVQEMKSARQ
ncbi:MAG: hypothetical protein HRT77_17095 [Halioglobus sp.]|nr:hypothetical protein [Halioglobus sp.]